MWRRQLFAFLLLGKYWLANLSKCLLPFYHLLIKVLLYNVAASWQPVVSSLKVVYLFYEPLDRHFKTCLYIDIGVHWRRKHNHLGDWIAQLRCKRSIFKCGQGLNKDWSLAPVVSSSDFSFVILLFIYTFKQIFNIWTRYFIQNLH